MDIKPKKFVSELDELKLVYYEILHGGSYCSPLGLYIKHFSEEESFKTLQRKIELSAFYAAEGVPTEEELLKRAMQNGDWTQEKEDKILEVKYLISDNEKTIHNIIPEQRGWLENLLEAKGRELRDLQEERKAFLGRGIEDLVNDDIEDYLAFLSYYKDEKFSKRYIDDYNEFQNIEGEKTVKLSHFLNQDYRRFDEANIKKVSCMPFFINKFSYTKDNIVNFLGVPVSKWTHNQNLLFSLGSRNITTLSQTKGSPPDITLEATPYDVVKWFDISHSIMIGKQNQSGT